MMKPAIPQASSLPGLRRRHVHTVPVVDFPVEGIDGRGHEGDHDDDSASVSSILSSRSTLSSNSDDESDASISSLSKVNAETLKEHFAFRDQLLHRMEKEQSTEYSHKLRDAEKTLRTEAMKLIEETKENVVTDRKSKQVEHGDSQKKQVDGSTHGWFRRQLAFELNYTLPGFATILLYCLAHSAMYTLVTMMVIEPFKNVGNEIYLYVFGLGLVWYRITGGVYYWLNDERYEQVKAELRHRQQQSGGAEAFLMRWFRNHGIIKTIMTLCSDYMIWISLSQFIQFNLMTPFDNRKSLLEGLPSVQAGVNSTIAKMLTTGFAVHYMPTNDAYEETCEEGNDVCEMSQWEADLTAEDDVYLFSKVSNTCYYYLMGFPGQPLVSITTEFWLNVMLALLSLGALRKFGIPAFD